MRPTRSQQRRAARTRRKSRLMRLKAWYEERQRYYVNRFKRRTPTEEEAQRNALLNSMTNWQRNKLLIACKGNADSASLGMLQDYAAMPHWKKAKAHG